MATTILPTIYLDGPSSNNDNFSFKKSGAKALDIISSTLLEPVTLITKGPNKAAELVKKRREEIKATKDLSKAFDVAGEAATSASIAAAATLGIANPSAALGVLKGLVPSTLGGKVAGITGAGILISSAKGREIAARFAQDPTKIGREAGILIDKAAKGEDVGGVVNALKTAGLIGAGVAATAGATKVVKSILNKKKGKTADAAINRPQQVPTSVVTQASPIPDPLDPISDTPVVSSPQEPTVQPMAEAPDINIKVINKPQINVAQAQSI